MVVEAPEGVIDRAGVVVLHEHGADARALEARSVVALEKEAPGVTEDARADQLEPGEGEFLNVHGAQLPVPERAERGGVPLRSVRRYAPYVLLPWALARLSTAAASMKPMRNAISSMHAMCVP